MPTVWEFLERKEKKIYSIHPSAPLSEAIRALAQHKIGALIVIENKDDRSQLVGIISERDIVRRAEQGFGQLESLRVSDLMTKDIIVGVLKDDISYAMSMMTQNKIRHLPIMEGEKVVGVVTIGDIVKALLSEESYENRMLRDYIDSKYPG